MTTILCFYHAPCNDGSAAAAALEFRLRQENYLDGAFDVRFAPVTYNTEWDEPFPETYLENEIQPKHDVREMFFVDISISPRKFDQLYHHLLSMGQISSGAIPVVCIDHHKTAIERLAELETYCTDTLIRIGPGLSGATLVWAYFNQRFNSTAEPPLLLQYVADQDIWEWQLPESREVNASLNVLSGQVEEMQKELERSLADPQMWLQERRDAGRAITALVTSQILRSERQVAEYPFSKGVLMVVNATSFNSELGNHLCERHDQTPNGVALIYSVQENWNVRCSLRSIPGGGITAREIAERYGGGGHDHAAGCRFPDFESFQRGITEIAAS